MKSIETKLGNRLSAFAIALIVFIAVFAFVLLTSCTVAKPASAYVSLYDIKRDYQLSNRETRPLRRDAFLTGVPASKYHAGRGCYLYDASFNCTIYNDTARVSKSGR
jgi:hypothetical protein